MKKLSDDEYRDILKERLVRVDADIALIDEDISNWKPSDFDNKDG